jgi:hypothetical protein
VEVNVKKYAVIIVLEDDEDCKRIWKVRKQEEIFRYIVRGELDVKAIENAAINARVKP